MGSLATALPIHQISLPTPWPSVGPVHAYLIRQEPVTLIDAGLHTQDSREALLAGLAQAGVGLQDIQRILITHAHMDHFGQAAWVAEASGAAIYLHPDEEGKANAPDWWLAGRDQLLHQAGVDADSMAEMEEAWRRGRRTCLPLPSWQPLTDGTTFAFERGSLEAIHLPGHALGHTGFYEAATGRLIGGDHLLDKVTPNPILEVLQQPHADSVPHDPLRALTLHQFVRSLDRVIGMELTEVLPGHGPVIREHRAIARDYQGRHQRRLTRLRDRLGGAGGPGGVEPGYTPWEVTQEVYPHVRGFDLFLALSEVLAHLDLLVVQGRAAFERTGEVNRYRPV